MFLYFFILNQKLNTTQGGDDGDGGYSKNNSEQEIWLTK